MDIESPNSRVVRMFAILQARTRRDIFLSRPKIYSAEIGYDSTFPDVTPDSVPFDHRICGAKLYALMPRGFIAIDYACSTVSYITQRFCAITGISDRLRGKPFAPPRRRNFSKGGITPNRDMPST